jgi:hypothetical protein
MMLRKPFWMSRSVTRGTSLRLTFNHSRTPSTRICLSPSHATGCFGHANTTIWGGLSALCPCSQNSTISVNSNGWEKGIEFLSNLLCPSPITGRPKLLSILGSYAQQTNQPALVETVTRIESLLATMALLNGAALDIVTFGTPVRYGWDTSGIGKLLHIVNHRNLRTDGKNWLAKMELPQVTMEMPIAWGGDYVQELAVAGSDAVATTEPAKAVNKMVWEIVEPYDGFERWLECARRAVRFPSEGRCLLVDYKDSTGSTNPRDHYFGHAVYTRRHALLFNTAQIDQTFYNS